MKTIRKLTLNSLAITALLVPAGMALSGCDANDGPAEQLGEEIDNAAENTGEKIDEAAEDLKDAVDDATDDTP